MKIEIRRCKLDTLMGSIRGSRTRWKKCTRAEITGYRDRDRDNDNDLVGARKSCRLLF